MAINKQLAAENLSRMIQINTVKDGDKTSHFEEFQSLLEELYPTVFQVGEKILIEGNLLIKIKGKDSSRNPILLMSHTDVVEAEGDWQYPPFSGEIAEDCIWGRGTVDTKGNLCAFLEATEDLLKSGFTPAVDLYLASSIDEETMGAGAAATVQYLAERNIKLDIVMDEGGAIVEAPMPGLSGDYAMLGIMEKGFANVKFTAKSSGGHASTPTNDTPIARLAAFVHEVNTKSPFKKEITPPVRDMFKSLAPEMSQPYKFLFENVDWLAPILTKVLSGASPQANALLATTCAFTMATGSGAANVIPESASVVANLRFMIHQPMEVSLRIIEEVAMKFDIEMEVLYAHDCSKVTSTDDRGYLYIVDCIKKHFPDVGISPYIMLGATDSRHYTQICDCVVRFAPLRLNNQQLGSPHGIDENIGIDSLYEGAKFYQAFLEGYK